MSNVSKQEDSDAEIESPLKGSSGIELAVNVAGTKRDSTASADDSITYDLQKNFNTEIRRNCCTRCCQRTKLAHCCIDDWQLIYSEDKKTGEQDARLEVVLVPEAFRMWFYYGIIIFMAVATTVSLLWADIPFEDTPFKKYFNANNPCVFFDYPPFNLFGAIGWMPQMFNLIIYELLDQFRVYDAYHDKDKGISLRFYRWYTVGTVFECLAFIAMAQVMATTPQENWVVHVLPYLGFTYALGTLAFKRFMYLRATKKLEEAVSEGHRWPKAKLYASYAYVITFWIVIIMKTAVVWPNLFGLRLWTRPGWAWTDTVLARSSELWFLCIIPVPIVIYWVITEKLEKVKFVINRVPME